MPTDSQQRPAKDGNENDEHQPPQQKGEEPDEKLPQVADASPKANEAPVKSEERPQDPPKPQFDATRLNFPSQFESDKKETFNFPTISERSMPHRVEPYPMTSSHRRHYEYDHHPRRSPPPISTMTHSPSTSDRSAVSTPSTRRSPPSAVPAPHMYSTPYPPHPHPHADPAMMSRQHHFRPELPHAYMYAPPPPHPMDQRPYDGGHPHDGPPQQSPYHQAAGVPPHMVPPMHPGPPRPDQHYAPPYPTQQGAPVFTDDAATKLSDRIRRRCFNCCTTDTSTWRRSNLSPGKV
ncbi:hypothetical protein C0991_008385, partial [Blastosporella zonata]